MNAADSQAIVLHLLNVIAFCAFVSALFMYVTGALAGALGAAEKARGREQESRAATLFGTALKWGAGVPLMEAVAIAASAHWPNFSAAVFVSHWHLSMVFLVPFLVFTAAGCAGHLRAAKARASQPSGE